MQKIIIIGAGPHAEVTIDIIEEEGKYEIVGIIDSKRELGSRFNKYKIIGRQENLIEICNELNTISGLVCIGDNWSRMKVVNYIYSKLSNFNFITTIHPKAVISKNAQIGKGNVIMPGVIINTKAVVGDFCIINTNSSLEHYCNMSNYSSLSAGVTTGGFVNIGMFAALALGVTIFDRVNIGQNTVVGSGSLVTNDLPDNVLAYGIPAKIVRTRKEGERFLK